MAMELCEATHPHVPEITCQLAEGHKPKDPRLWFQGVRYDHLSRDPESFWFEEPDNEREEAVASALAAVIAESSDALSIFQTALEANGFELRRTGNPSTGAHASA